MKATYQTISIGLDQLYTSPFMEDETVQDRSNTIETFLSTNGWSWDLLNEELAKEVEASWTLKVSSKN